MSKIDLRRNNPNVVPNQFVPEPGKNGCEGCPKKEAGEGMCMWGGFVGDCPYNTLLSKYIPEPGEFTKAYRNDLKQFLDGHIGKYLIVDGGRAACDRIDRLESEKKELINQHTDYCHTAHEVTGKLQAELRLAQQELGAADKEVERLKKVIKAALRIKDLWTLKEVESMFEDEAKALNLMAEGFEKALKGEPK